MKIVLQSPRGGPDGGKDIVCSKDGKRIIVGCYFAKGQKLFSKIRDKFIEDWKAAIKNKADGFIFMTNQNVTGSENRKLCSIPNIETVIYYGEDLVGILDSPIGYGIRQEYLEIELSKAEMISFFAYKDKFGKL